MVVSRIDRKEASLRGIIYLKLREAIIDGRLRPGEMLVEERLARELDVSRTPLREALVKLEHEGLIVSIPYRGTFVASPSRAEVVQIIQVRERLEPLAIELAIDVIPDAEIERVMDLIGEREARLSEGDLPSHFACNSAVHRLAPQYCGNPILEGLIGSLEEKIHPYRHLKAATEDNLQEIICSAQEHLGILRAYAARDGVRAIDLMVKHLQRVQDRLGSAG